MNTRCSAQGDNAGACLRSVDGVLMGRTFLEQRQNSEPAVARQGGQTKN